MTRPTWWRRNRLWLAVLPPLLLLAVVASSFRLVTLYLPWEWSRPVVPHAASGTLRQEFLGSDDARHTREVRVTALSAVSHQEAEGMSAAPGAILWRVLLEFDASPDQILQTCTMELQDAAGRRYGHQGGVVRTDWSVTPLYQTCVPEDAPGPTLAPLTGELVPSPVERPRTWQRELVVATPLAVEPTAVRIGWDRPDYLVLDLP